MLSFLFCTIKEHPYMGEVVLLLPAKQRYLMSGKLYAIPHTSFLCRFMKQKRPWDVAPSPISLSKGSFKTCLLRSHNAVMLYHNSGDMMAAIFMAAVHRV